jgi:hypothetical protein
MFSVAAAAVVWHCDCLYCGYKSPSSLMFSIPSNTRETKALLICLSV